MTETLHSTPASAPQKLDGFAARFWSHVAIGAADECWPWMLSLGSKGYGQVRQGGRIVRAHRVAWELTNGPVPDGLWVLHSCDNRPCCNTAHHFLGDHDANMADMMSKGRHARQRGEEGPAAKLTAADVLEIRRRRAAGERGLKVAADFGISPAAVSHIKHRRTWTEV